MWKENNMINIKVRIKQKWFWLAIIPAVLMLITQIGAIFGFQIDTALIGEQLAAVVNTVFLILAILGIVVDPTTEGISDSALAMTYEAPKPKESEEG